MPPRIFYGRIKLFKISQLPASRRTVWQGISVFSRMARNLRFSGSVTEVRGNAPAASIYISARNEMGLAACERSAAERSTESKRCLEFEFIWGEG